MKGLFNRIHNKKTSSERVLDLYQICFKEGNFAKKLPRLIKNNKILVNKQVQKE